VTHVQWWTDPVHKMERTHFADPEKMYQYAHCVYYGTLEMVFEVQGNRYEVTCGWVVRNIQG